jgi:hypothetical protein
MPKKKWNSFKKKMRNNEQTKEDIEYNLRSQSHDTIVKDLDKDIKKSNEENETINEPSSKRHKGVSNKSPPVSPPSSSSVSSLSDV